MSGSERPPEPGTYRYYAIELIDSRSGIVRLEDVLEGVE
jgi:hypothetical protein